MTEIKTDQKLIEAVKRAAEKRLSPDEIRRQQISFILGSLREDSAVTEEQVEEVLARLEGRAA